MHNSTVTVELFPIIFTKGPKINLWTCPKNKQSKEYCHLFIVIVIVYINSIYQIHEFYLQIE